ncbi:hypothetical protein WQ54_16760 [Bacillus sp. SA1-12]|uniref:hypothetical protein n=1 Tax=Bacillus sp. SA1-12 TaxID=1455638 RepID=UPI000627101F|nr:hypothetical protein [Bacillus sp. SA1-12]KKI91102.1 hypothetical protein WQ54_16760 [Bacillus sp. SA1-12]
MKQFIVFGFFILMFLSGCMVSDNLNTRENEITTTFDEIQKKYPNAMHQPVETEDGKKDLEAEKEILFIAK